MVAQAALGKGARTLALDPVWRGPGGRLAGLRGGASAPMHWYPLDATPE